MTMGLVTVTDLYNGIKLPQVATERLVPVCLAVESQDWNLGVEYVTRNDSYVITNNSYVMSNETFTKEDKCWEITVHPYDIRVTLVFTNTTATISVTVNFGRFSF